MKSLYNCILLLLIFGIITTNLNAQACDLISGNLNLGGPSHDVGFQENDKQNMVATLSNGNFVVAWETRDDVDGDRHGGFFQVFSETGVAVTGVITPYLDVNPMGTGDQGTFGPKVVALNTGFVIVWDSENGPGDIGAPGDDMTDLFFRLYDNNGNSINSSTRVSVPNEEDILEFVLPLSSGGFVILNRIEEGDDNKDDLYFEAYDAAGNSTSGGFVIVAGGAHNNGFQSVDNSQCMIDLGNGTFVVTWETRDDVDGEGNGGFFRVFNINGSPVTDIIAPHFDINASGIGDQGTPGPKVIRLQNGNFVIAWESREAPGDIGPGGSGVGDPHYKDIYMRIYNTDGIALTGTAKANSDNVSDTEELVDIIALEGGGFAIYYYRNEYDPGNNKDDYFIRTFAADGTPTSGSFEVSSGAHLEAFCTVSSDQHGIAALSNGNFVVSWAARDDSDGDDAGAYYRVFNESGAPVSAVVRPYIDINPNGIGKQSTFGPRVEALPNGFVIAWQSEGGPQDVGPSEGNNSDVYHRVIDNTGSPLCSSTKTNTGSDAEEEILLYVEALNNGNFTVVFKEQEEPGDNKDDYYIRVIGGAPLQAVCPALGNVTTTASSICLGETFNVSITGLQNLSSEDNNDQDYGIRFVAFAASTSNPYNGGTLLGTVTHANLTGGGTSASLNNVLINNPDTELFIYAILDSNPEDANCIPAAQTTVAVNPIPTVNFSNLNGFCVDAGVQTGLGGGTPTGGVYSGGGVTNSGNGTNFSFSPSSVGVGVHTITYDYTDGNGCSSSSTTQIQVFNQPTVSFSAPASLCIDAGLQSNLGGGTPSGGTYSGLGVTDDGNGMTYSFNPTISGIGNHAITYTYSDVNGCMDSMEDNLEVTAEPTVSFTAPSNLCINAEVQNGLGDGSPIGGVYSGPGVMDDGNGMTYTFDPSTAGLGTHNIMYSYVDASGCSANANGTLEVLEAPTVSLDLPDTLLMTQANPLTGIGGGSPAGGTYTANFPNEMSDDGNGMTFSFTSEIFIGDVIDIIYSYTDANGCTNTATETIFIGDLSTDVVDFERLGLKVFPNPTTGILYIQGGSIDHLSLTDLQGRSLLNQENPNKQLDISNLPSGLYFLRVVVDDEIATTRIIKE